MPELVPEPEDDLRACMGSTAHALNNVLNILYAAASHLERPEDVTRAARARAAVENAGGSLQAVSAALSLLALGAGDMTAAALLQSRSAPIEPYDFEHLKDALRAAADVVPEGVAAPDADARWPLPFDLIEALLLCAAVTLKRSAPPGAPLSCGVSADASPRPRLVFELRINRAAGEPSKPSLHPCSSALDYAARLFAGYGVDVEQQPGHYVRVHLFLRSAA